MTKRLEEAVAKALFDLGAYLASRGDHAEAKKLLTESLERAPSGPTAEGALALLRAVNERLGIANRDHGAPMAALRVGPQGLPESGAAYPAETPPAETPPAETPPADKPLDPYRPQPPAGGKAASAHPLDPYPLAPPPDAGVAGPLDPYGEPAAPGAKTDQPLDPYDRPRAPGSGADQPLDPYGGPRAPQVPLDPYRPGLPAGPSGDAAPGAGESREQQLRDPYGEEPMPIEVGRPALAPPDRSAADRSAERRPLLVWGGLYGFLAAAALAGPQDSRGAVGSAMLAGSLGAGAALALTHLASRRWQPSPGGAQAFVSASTWGAYSFAMLGDALTGVGSTTFNESWWSAALGATAGAGAGLYFATQVRPSAGDVWLVNSLGLYGTAAGLLVAVAAQPATAEAYSLPAAVGATLGIGLGVVLSRRMETTPSRLVRVNLGALAGLATSWAIVYPLISNPTTRSDERAAGLLAMATTTAGAWAAWRLSRPRDEQLAPAPAASFAALFCRGPGREWTLGVPIPRPLDYPQLAAGRGGSGLAVDLVAGRF